MLTDSTATLSWCVHTLCSLQVPISAIIGQSSNVILFIMIRITCLIFVLQSPAVMTHHLLKHLIILSFKGITVCFKIEAFILFPGSCQYCNISHSTHSFSIPESCVITPFECKKRTYLIFSLSKTLLKKTDVIPVKRLSFASRPSMMLIYEYKIRHQFLNGP